jgi:hypothetical protein
MADLADVASIDPDLEVVVAGVTSPAVTIEGALYQPTEGDTVVTILLSDGSRLLLGPVSS